MPNGMHIEFSDVQVSCFGLSKRTCVKLSTSRSRSVLAYAMGKTSIICASSSRYKHLTLVQNY